MELKDARRYRQPEKENAELKQMLADSLLKIRVLEEETQKKGEPFAEATSGQGGSQSAQRGVPAHLRSDNGSEFVARALQAWLAKRSIKTLYIEPGSPWQNGHVESFHGSLRDECLDRELMLSVTEARVVIEDYRSYYNAERPHGGLGYRAPAQTFREVQARDAEVASITLTA